MSAELKSKVVAFARGVGFDSCRVATCRPPPHANEFRTWLEDGAHGEMHYMKRGAEKRSDPQRVLPGAKSIIVLALNYWQGNFRRSQTAATGRIARYAWGDDYHDVITAKLDKIDIFIPQHDTAARHDYHRFRGVQFSQHLCFNFAEFFFAEFGKDLPDRQTKLKCSHFVRIKSTAPSPSLQATPDRRFTRAHHSNKHNRSRGTHAAIC